MPRSNRRRRLSLHSALVMAPHPPSPARCAVCMVQTNQIDIHQGGRRQGQLGSRWEDRRAGCPLADTGSQRIQRPRRRRGKWQVSLADNYKQVPELSALAFFNRRLHHRDGDSELGQDPAWFHPQTAE